MDKYRGIDNKNNPHGSGWKNLKKRVGAFLEIGKAPTKKLRVTTDKQRHDSTRSKRAKLDRKEKLGL